MEIITNNQWRYFLSWHDLTDKEREEFEQDSTEGYFRYRGRVYAIDEFMVIPEGMREILPGDWDGYLSDSFFSGVLLQIDNSDLDRYRVATFIN